MTKQLEYTGKIQPRLGERDANGQQMYPYLPYDELIEAVNLAIYRSDRTGVLIFSDAGAARGGYSEERYNVTKEFIGKLQNRVRYIAWLNPVPKECWSGTTASDIARLAPMFEVSRRGMQNAINVLWGRKYG